jgi:hypothetical protein
MTVKTCLKNRKNIRFSVIHDRDLFSLNLISTLFAREKYQFCKGMEENVHPVAYIYLLTFNWTQIKLRRV